MNQRRSEPRVIFAAHQEAEVSQVRKHGSRAVLSLEARAWPAPARAGGQPGSDREPAGPGAVARGLCPLPGFPKEPSHWERWDWLMTVRVRTISPRLRPVEKGGTDAISPIDGPGGSSSVWGRARGLAAARVPSRSKTIRAAPSRSTRLPGGPSFESGRLSRASRTRQRRASTGAWVRAIKKRESVERAGSRSRSHHAHGGDCKGVQPLVEGFPGAFTTDGRARSGLRESRSPAYVRHPRRRGIRACTH